MRLFRSLASCSFLALMPATAVAQVTTIGTNRSEVQDSGRDNQAQVDNGAPDNDRNASLIVFGGSGNRATVRQVGDDNSAASRHLGDGNISSLRQHGFRNSMTLLQNGNNNGSSVDQFLDPRIATVGDRIAQVEQWGDSNSSSVVQVHWSNTATVIQGTESQRSSGAVSTIYQYSAGNTARVRMFGGSPDAPNRSHVEQTRIDPTFTSSTADVSLTGTFNLSYLYQVGAGNSASHSVTGTQNTIIGRSYGNALINTVVQEGYRNNASLNQFAGDRNSSRIEQRDLSPERAEGDRQVYVTQAGSDNSSTVVQRSALNLILVNQSGYGTISSINQSGPRNFARASLSDGSVAAFNRSTIVQEKGPDLFDARLTADVSIRGLGNESTVSQYGMRHVASVDMGGGGTGTDETGRRRGNTVAIVQDRSLPNVPNEVTEAGHTARVQVGLLANGGIGTSTSIQQSGQHRTTGNDAVVRQDGVNDRVMLVQATRFSNVEGGAVANIAARGVRNQITIQQYGRQVATITQGLGRDSSLTAVAYDSGGSRLQSGLFADGRGSNSLDASQYGDRNTADIWQEGTSNSVRLWQQTGSSDNSASINQGRNTFISVDGFSCQLRCQFSSGGLVSVTQGGRFNTAAVAQYGSGTSAFIDQRGSGSAALPNGATITQFNLGGEAFILQTANVGPSQTGDPASGNPGDPSSFAGGARAAEARIRQTGGALSARIEQRGRGQYALIDQQGANSASVLQDTGATNATAIITQSGSGNSYNVVQTQPGQYINVSQTGTNNSVTTVISRP